MPLVVILDDQVTNRKIFSKLAASIDPDVTVRAFGDPVVALAWLSENTPDLIVTDYKMPYMDGAEFIRRFRDLPGTAEIPIIVITIYEERSFRMRALEAGATDFLQSPVDHPEFVTRARNLLKLRKQQLLLATYAQNLARKLEVSERSREEALRDSSERLAQVIDTVPAMISATDRQGRYIFANAYQASIAGVDPSAMIGKDTEKVFGDEFGARSRALDRQVFEAETALPSFEEEIVDRSGIKRIFLTTKSPLRDRSSAITAVLTSAIDITDRKQAERHLLYMAHHDGLTDLPNRVFLRDRLRREIARARRGDSSFALHVVDIDGFKSVNDMLGHPAGDRYLKNTAQRLRSCVDEDGVVARLGGDEFAVLQTGLANDQEAADLAARIIKAVQEPQILSGERVTCAASVGITLHPGDGADVHTLLKNADLAMYRAKSEGGNVYCFFAADMSTRAVEAANLDRELRVALEQNQFVLYYQPLIDLRTDGIIGAEALLRWMRPGQGIATPGVFLARAEENGLIVPINEWVLREACREAKSWVGQGLPPMRISVNLSPIQFRKQSVPLLIAKILGDTGLEPGRLEVELTENIVMQDTDVVADELRRLHELGVGIAIDDFGTGYSSLTYVKHFPVDRIKIDQCFVRNLACDPHDAAIVRAIVSLGHSLELKIVAEGVETAEQVELLRAERCDEMQGYYIAKPMPAQDFIAFVRGQPALARTA